MEINKKEIENVNEERKNYEKRILDSKERGREDGIKKGKLHVIQELADKFEKLQKTMSCEVLKFSRSELDKTRFRKQTDKGTDIGCILDSENKLHNGDVMYSNTEKFIIIEQIPDGKDESESCII